MKYLALISCFCLLATAADEKKLKVERLALSHSEDGTPVPSDFTFLPGDTVFFSCQVSRFAKTADDDPKVSLSYQIEARDAKGVLIVPVETGKVVSELAPEDKAWHPKIRHTIALPPLADSGRYEVTVRVRDELGKTEAPGSIPLLIQGREVAPSETLVVRNFRFLRSEEDKNPLQIPAYRPGDMVWARFDMTGYKLGEKNRLDVEYGLKVLRPDGGVAYEQPQAASQKNEAFYPERYMPGILSLSLPKDMNKGEYTILLTVRDNVGNQTYGAEQKFSIE